MSTINIAVILGSVRENRASEKPAVWLTDTINQRDDMQAELLDLKKWNLPHVTTPKFPGSYHPDYPDETVQEWSQKIEQADAIIIVTPEYNHGYPGQVKDAIDVIYPEWKLKPISIVGISSGRFGGARMREQLRQVIIALNAVPVLDTLSFGNARDQFDDEGNLTNEHIKDNTPKYLDRLKWWAETLKENRKNYPA